MDDSKTPQAVVSGPKLPLSAVARAVTRFWFGQAQLPTSLSFYGGFFTGFFTAAAVAPALFAYMDRHKSDPSKIQLVVFHVVRLFEQRPDYWRLSANPRMLLAKMEHPRESQEADGRKASRGARSHSRADARHLPSSKSNDTQEKGVRRAVPLQPLFCALTRAGARASPPTRTQERVVRPRLQRSSSLLVPVLVTLLILPRAVSLSNHHKQSM
jgi:hypothetical protein